jgi:hypothetical protein
MTVHTIVALIALATIICATGFGVAFAYHLIRFSPSKQVAAAAIVIYTLGAVMLSLVIWGTASLI